MRAYHFTITVDGEARAYNLMSESIDAVADFAIHSTYYQNPNAQFSQFSVASGHIPNAVDLGNPFAHGLLAFDAVARKLQVCTL